MLIDNDALILKLHERTDRILRKRSEQVWIAGRDNCAVTWLVFVRSYQTQWLFLFIYVFAEPSPISLQ